MSTVAFLSLGSAVAYVSATIVMKRWDAIGHVQSIVLVLIALGAAVALETEALRQARLGHIYVVILGFETCLTAVCAWLLLRETYAAHEVLGLGLVILGVAVTHAGPAVSEAP